LFRQNKRGAASDKYVAVDWDEAFREIGAELKQLAPPSVDADGRYRLMTLRSNDQFNTTIYGYHVRFPGVKGTRDVLFLNSSDIARDGPHEGQIVALESDAADGNPRSQRVDRHALQHPRGVSRCLLARM
jgi:anaerobic selenocysteine-containing dehydrogenase